MPNDVEYLNAAEAAQRLGVSAKALRIYERRGLIAPLRTSVGWRAYGPKAMARAAEVVALRALGLSLAAVSRVLDGELRDLEPALAAQQSSHEARIRQLAEAVASIRAGRAGLATGGTPPAGALAALLEPPRPGAIAFALPWPWGGEGFETPALGPLAFITGPLGSGKTRFAQRLAQALPDAAFLGLDRLPALDAGPAHAERVSLALAWLCEDGATRSDALLALLAAVEADQPAALVIDTVEHGLDEPTQAALIAYLRRRGPGARTLVLMTRSNVILDLGAVGPDEAILYCPANHSPPFRVAPYPGAPGYEAVSTCLASPEVRARTAGLTATVAT